MQVLHFTYQIKEIIKKRALKLLGISMPDMEETNKLLTPFKIRTVAETKVSMPSVRDTNTGREIFREKPLIAQELYVWDYNEKGSAISRHGSVVINGNVLCTDWNNKSFKKGLLTLKKRKLKKVPVAIAPFAHAQHPEEFGGYYDFVFFVAAKLSRIKDALPGEDIYNMVISYHPFGGHYEKEYMKLLGFNPDNFIDSRYYKVSAKRIILGNGGSWLPNTAEIDSLKENISEKLTLSETYTGNRIYISRKGRRRIENEQEVIQLLKKFNFVIVEDKNRSVPEQIEIYRNASFILGPHGASFTNIIWCRPGTHLYEFFSRSYVPDYFLYLSTVNNMKYSAYKDERGALYTNFKDALYQNMYVSIEKLEATLEKLFSEENNQ